MPANMQKFLFDTDFATPRVHAVDVDYQTEEEVEDEVMEEAPPPPPTFSEEELALAREQALQAGRAQGLQEAAESLEQMVGMAMASCAHHLQTLGAVQNEANQAVGRDAVAIALAVLRKLHPEFCRRYGVNEIEAALGEILAHIDMVPRVTVRVHPELVEAVREKSVELTVTASFEGRLVVSPDPALPLGDCRIDWGEGGAERVTARAWSDVERAIEEILGKLPTAQSGL